MLIDSRIIEVVLCTIVMRPHRSVVSAIVVIILIASRILSIFPAISLIVVSICIVLVVVIVSMIIRTIIMIVSP